ncbi:MAG TPA: IS110 family transposase [Candidatus Dormibacteraeota bacterium]|nr:IS110 family transposase [Candidatus Dormibacteraeota bacterium]
MQYVGFDAHKKYTFFTQMDARGQIQRQGKLANDRDALATFFAKIEEPARVVIEATMNWYHLYDLLESLQIPVTLAHPLRTRAIAEAKVKTDKVDSTILAHLLRTDLIPAAYIPPQAIRDLRELLRYRAALVKLQTMVKNRTHAILLKHGYQSPYTDTFGKQGRAWLGTLALRPVYQQALRGFLTVLDTLQTQIQEASHTVDQQAKATPAAQALCTLPGVGHYTALLILAEIGDVHRFPDPKHLVSYAGLAPRVHQSGGRVYTGHISKQGSSWLRWILVEAAIRAVHQPGRYQTLYERLAQRKGRKLARVVVARELLTTIYWLLRHVH